jgi:hypothetical protein
MGLLSRAVSKQAPELDEMGTALRDRILRLPPKKTSPYTALSLLKAYAAFQCGLCFALKGESYTSYAGFGLGVEKVSVPREAFLSLFEKNMSPGYYRIESPDFIPAKTPDLVFWAFPLGGEDPWKYALILGAESASGFNPSGMDRMLQEIRRVLLPRETAGENIEKEIARFHHTHSPFAGIVFEAADKIPGAEWPRVQKRLSTMTALSGAVIPLTPRRSLVLLSAVLDRELIAHRIAKSLPMRTLRIFEAGSPGKALSAITPFLS